MAKAKKKDIKSIEKERLEIIGSCLLLRSAAKGIEKHNVEIADFIFSCCDSILDQLNVTFEFQHGEHEAEIRKYENVL